MKIAIIGDTSSGKSTFGERLSKVTKIPIYHTDLIRIDQQGKEIGNACVKQEINKWLQKKERIIEGNALRADPEQRIQEADIVFLFDFNKAIVLYNVCRRWIKINIGKMERYGFHDNKKKRELNLGYYIPYIFINFPKRKRELKKTIQKYQKNTITFKSYADINNYDFSEITQTRKDT